MFGFKLIFKQKLLLLAILATVSLWSFGLAGGLGLSQTRAQTATSYDKYIWEFLSPQNIAPAADSLKQKLEAEILKVTSAEHLAPYRALYGETTAHFYWYHRYDVVYTLALAYPYLTQAAQSQVKTYLQSEMQAYPLWTEDLLNTQVGARREPDDLSAAERENLPGEYGNRPKLFALYALWLYAQNTQDWTLVENNWAAITDFYNRNRLETTKYYTSLAGAIGMARMAQQKPVKDSATLTAVLGDLTIGLNNGKDFLGFATNSMNAYLWTTNGWSWTSSDIFLGFHFLDISPEIGRYMFDDATLKSRVLGSGYDFATSAGPSTGGVTEPFFTLRRGEFYFPLWYLGQSPAWSRYFGEGSAGPPDTKAMIFPLKAWVVKEPATKLNTYLDVPDTSLGDFYYMQNLARTIQAYGSETWFNLLTSTSSTIQNTITGLTSALNPATYGQAVTFNIQVSSAGSGLPTGTVTILDGTTQLGNATLNNGTASFTSAILDAGVHSITAFYNGDGNFTSSSSPGLNQTVGQAVTTTGLTSSANPVPSGMPITLTATVSVVAPGAGQAAGTVTFKDGATILGTGTLNVSGTASFSTTSLASGTHSLTAIYEGSPNFKTSTSTVLNQAVTDSSCNPLVVTSATDNSDCGTLRAAFIQANNLIASQPVTIQLNTGLVTLDSGLPQLVNTGPYTLTITAACPTQTAGGFNRGVPGAWLKPTLNGSGMPNFTGSGLSLTKNTVVSGLVITGFTDFGIDLAGDNNKINCSWIGTRDGLVANPNGLGGIRIAGNNNHLGTAGQSQSGNLISGNNGPALVITSGKDTWLANNWIGLQKDGLTVLVNKGGLRFDQPGSTVHFLAYNFIKN